MRQTNLASRVLGLAVAAGPKHGQQRTGVQPLLAETFVDPKRYAGTCYQAAGWAEVGGTAGFARQGGRYYVAHGAAKRLWLRPLSEHVRCCPSIYLVFPARRFTNNSTSLPSPVCASSSPPGSILALDTKDYALHPTPKIHQD